MVPKNILISIVAPVYRTRPYLKKLLNSIKKQTYKNWELILIDDRGEDGSLELMEQYSRQDHRIKVISNDKNRGVDFSRFEGIKNAKGEFLMFIDSDDWISEQALETLLNKIIEENADVVYGSMARVLDKWGFIKSKLQNFYGPLKTDSIETPELFDTYFVSYFGINKLSVSMCGKLYRKSIIDDAQLQPTLKKMGEDLTFNMTLHPFLKKVAFVPDLVYYYRFGGMTDSANPSFLEDIKFQYYLKKGLIEKYNYYKAYFYIKIELVNCFFSHFYNMKLLNKISSKELEMLVLQELEDPIYQELSVGIKDSAKTEAILNKEVEKIISMIDQSIRKKRHFFLVKKTISNILK